MKDVYNPLNYSILLSRVTIDQPAGKVGEVLKNERTNFSILNNAKQQIYFCQFSKERKYSRKEAKIK